MSSKPSLVTDLSKHRSSFSGSSSPTVFFLDCSALKKKEKKENEKKKEEKEKEKK